MPRLEITRRGTPDPWERQENEGDKAFRAFCLYRDMGVDRTLTKVKEKLACNLNLVKRWSMRWGWRSRASAWDDHLDWTARERLRRGIGQMAERHATIAQAMLAKSVERLRSLDPTEMDPRDLVEMVKAGVEIERVSRGEPTEIVEGTGRPGVVVVPAMLASAGDWAKAVQAERSALEVAGDDSDDDD